MNTSDQTNFLKLLETEKGIILACFISGVLSMSFEAYKAPLCPIIIILICAILAGTIISILCPIELNYYVAIALIFAASFGFVLRLWLLQVNCDCADSNSTNLTFPLLSFPRINV